MKLNKAQIDTLIKQADAFKWQPNLYSIQKESFTMMPYNYGDEITEYVHWMYENELVVTDYTAIENDYIRNYNNDAWYEQLNEEAIIKCLALAIRKERFVDGFLLKTIHDKSFFKLINRLKQIHTPQ